MSDFDLQDDFDDLDDYGEASDPQVVQSDIQSEPSVESEFDDLDDLDDSELFSDVMTDARDAQLAHIATDAFGDMEDLLSDFGEKDEVAIPEANDTEILTNLQLQCSKLGFPLSEDVTVEQAEHVYKYAQDATQELQNIGYMTANINEVYQNALGAIGYSSSMQIKQDSNATQFKSRLLNSVRDTGLREVCGKIISFTWDAISAEERKGVPINEIEIDRYDIFRSLQAYAKSGLGNFSDTYNTVNSDAILNFIDTSISTIKNNKIVGETLARNAEVRKLYVSQRLMHQFYTFVSAYNTKEHAMIERIDTFDGGDLTCTCQRCKAAKKVNALMHFTFYSSDKSIRLIAFPEANFCECGALLTFPIKTCIEAGNYFLHENEHEIRAALTHANNFGKGIAVISCTPTVAQLPPELQSLVYDNATAITHRQVQNRTEIFIAEDEWMRAVKDFYAHLDVLRCDDINLSTWADKRTAPAAGNVVTTQITSTNYPVAQEVVANTNTQLLSIVAANVAQVAGVDYNTVKGKALVSLLTFLGRNDYLQKHLRFDDVIIANLTVALTKRYVSSSSVDLNKASKLIFDNLMAVAGLINKNVKVTGDRNDVLKFLSETLPALEAYVSRVNTEYASLWSDLEASQYALSFVPIVDYKQTSIYSIMQVITSESKFRVLNDVCDRMIITKYSGEYFKFWCRLNLQHTNTLQSRLMTLSDVKQIDSAVNLVMDDCFSQFGVSKTPEYFANIIVQGTEKWKILRRLSESVSACNYYRFCKDALKLAQTDFGFGTEYNAIISSFVSENYSEFANTTNCTEAEYYLHGVFSAEEIASAEEELSYLVFGRYVPMRLENETIQEYIRRFKSVDITKCYDNLDRFSRVKHLGAILFGAAISEAKFENFRVSNFVVGLLNAVVKTNSMQALGNVGLSDLRKNMLMNSMHEWTFADFNNNNVDAVTLINAYYMTDAEDAVMNTFSAVSEAYFVAGTNIQPIAEIMNFDDTLMHQLEVIASNPEASDMASMVSELRAWEYTQGYAERFAGE